MVEATSMTGDEQYDTFTGFQTSLFGFFCLFTIIIIRNTPYEEDDKEADDIYESVANRMAERRSDRKEDLERQRVELLDREHMDVKRQFEDLKVFFFSFYNFREDLVVLPWMNGIIFLKLKTVH